MAVILTNLKMTIESESYIDAMHAVLTHKGWATYSKPMLAGMTSAAFRFTVNRRLTAEGPTAYNWIAENFLAADFIGIAASSNAGFTFDATFPLYRDAAILQIKKAIDDGTGAVIWKDQFVVAAGYDDERQILLLSNGKDEELEQLPYHSFGCNQSPYWYYQVLENRIPLDHMEVCRESLMQAVYRWETHDPMLPESGYACGRSAYAVITSALQNGEYDREGWPTVLRSYAASKRDIRSYFTVLETYWPSLREAALQYACVAESFEEAKRLVQSDHMPTIERLIPLLNEACQAEEKAIMAIKSFMRETIDIRKGDIALR
ncbi:hypothetical protein [Paenibacillus sp. YAF4_2]|uniref:hypothetical protein n=1 Tax=Paenibacillus sp. YAF4_2 TaxID=3233085 RepID=UPI003F95C06D